MGTKLLDCTCLSNFPAPKLLRNPTLNCTRLYMAWGEQFARRKRKNLHVSIKGYLVPSSWGWSLYLLEDIGVFPHCPISPAVSLGVDPTLPPKWWEWMHFSHYLFYVQSPFITNVTSLIMFCCSYPKLVMMTYLCQIFIWRGFLLIVNVRVKKWRRERVLPPDVQKDESVSERTGSSSLPTPGLTNIPVLGHLER